MGTNYYLKPKVQPEIDSLFFTQELELHIGKSSAGWVFSLCTHPDKGIHDLSDWEKLFKNPAYKIQSEYSEEVSAYKMMDIITNRSCDIYLPDKVDLKANFAMPGPNNLLRHEIDRFCVGHGEGTWDLCVGEFS